MTPQIYYVAPLLLSLCPKFDGAWYKTLNPSFMYSNRYLFALIFLIFLLIFILIITHTKTDIITHASMALEIRNGVRAIYIPFFYYFLLIASTLFSSDIQDYYLVSVPILATLTFFRFYVVEHIFKKELLFIPGEKKAGKYLPILGALLLVFTFSIPGPMILDKGYFYLGNIPPNVWHNSTTILVTPFALLLFWLSLKQLYQFDQKRLLYIFVLIVINAISKPSFLFAYIPAYTIMVFWHHRISTRFWKAITPVAFSIFCVGISYLTVYIFKDINTDNNSVGISLFYVIKTRFLFDGAEIFYFLIHQIVCSFLFPIVLLLRQRDLWSNKAILFALSLQFFSIVIYHTLVENGSRMGHINFGWTGIISNYILFFVCLLELLKLITKEGYNFKKYKWELLSFSIHVLSAFVYISKLIILGSIR